jgi:hypothetical protein
MKSYRQSAPLKLSRWFSRSRISDELRKPFLLLFIEIRKRISGYAPVQVPKPAIATLLTVLTDAGYGSWEKERKRFDAFSQISISLN